LAKELPLADKDKTDRQSNNQIGIEKENRNGRLVESENEYGNIYYLL
jgi:hypothetical protein